MNIISTFETLDGQIFNIEDHDGTQKITNASGNIAFRWFQPGGYNINTGDPADPLMFRTEANISLCWVKPKWEALALRHKAGCCNAKRQAAHYANQDDVRRWTNRGGS